MKNNKAKKVLAILLIAVVLTACLTACGKKPSGTYRPETPNDPDVIFTSLSFDGGTVHVEVAGSSIGFDYTLKDGTLSFKDSFNFNVGGKSIPTSFSFEENDDGSFLLDGVKYIPA